MRVIHKRIFTYHHSGTSVVQLNGTLLKLGLLRVFVPAEIKGTVTEVTNECVVAGNILSGGQEIKI